MQDLCPSSPQTESPESRQAWLFGIAEAPAGFHSLSSREQKFVLAYLQSGSTTAAAKSAGYGQPSRGSELRKKPDVSAVIAQALRQGGATPERNAARIEEAAVYWHQRSLDETVGSKERRECAAAAHRYATLLASIHGKLGLNLTGHIHHTGEIRVTVDKQREIAESRKRYLERLQNRAGRN